MKGRLRKSKSADCITSLRNETKMLVACKKLRETNENHAKGFQKLHEKVKDIARKLIDRKASEARVTKKESQVLTDKFKERILIGNTTYGDSGIEEKKVEIMGYIIAKQLPNGNEACITELIMGCQKLDENQEEGIDQIMRNLEDVDEKVENQAKEMQKLREVTENQAKEIQKLHEKLEDLKRTKKKWSFEVDRCTMKDLGVLTDNFSEENIIGDTTYGKLYRGKLELDSNGSKTKPVVVKIWDDKVDRIDDGKVVKEEVKFLANSQNYQRNLPRLISFCNYGECSPGLVNGVVYDINPLDRLFNYIPRDNFSWIQRIKVAFELARLLRFLHLPDDRPYVLFNWDTENILLNQEYSPIVVDFGLLCGGQKGGPRLTQESGYMPSAFYDPYLKHTNYVRTAWNDVYQYGVILLGLLTKRVDSKELRGIGSDEKILTAWASREYSGDGCSLVDSSFTEDGDYEVSDGIALTKLAMTCISGDEIENFKRPSAFAIANRLLKLVISKRPELHLSLKPF